MNLNANSRIAVANMEGMGFVSAEDFLQLADQFPAAYIIAEKMLNLDRGALGNYLKTNKLSSTDFLPQLLNQLDKWEQK